MEEQKNRKPYINEDVEDYIVRQIKYGTNYCFAHLLTGKRCLSPFDTMATDQFTRYGVCTQCFSLMGKEHRSRVMKFDTFKGHYREEYSKFGYTRKLIENK